ncbi:hypothetical protein B1A_07062, partial [mine drainage metagenome]
HQLEQVVIATPTGAQIPLGEVATITFSRGPSMIRDGRGASSPDMCTST